LITRVTWANRRACGLSGILRHPQITVTDSGTWFSDLHAVLQAWQPMHRVWSMTLIQLGSPFETATAAACTDQLSAMPWTLSNK
jgi:hypothetical protein